MTNAEEVILFLGPIESPLFEWLKNNGESVIQTSDKITPEFIISNKVDYCYTNGAIDLFKEHPKIKTAAANLPRWLFSKFSVPFTARLFGGYSLLVLAK